jgi:hypothetical protein
MSFLARATARVFTEYEAIGPFWLGCRSLQSHRLPKVGAVDRSTSERPPGGPGPPGCSRRAWRGDSPTELFRLLAWGRFGTVIDVDDVRAFALTLPRTIEALVRDRVKFRVGRIVYLAFSHDETIMGFAFPKEEREALVRSEPHKFLMPDRTDLRYQWVQVRLDAIDEDEMRELVLDAWRMVVPKRIAAEHAARG